MHTLHRLSIASASLLTFVAVAGLMPREARACGAWDLKDEALGRTVTFYVETVLLGPKGSARGPRKLVLRVTGTSPEDLHSLAGKQKDMYFEGNTLRRKSRTLATLEGDQLTFGKTAYRVAVERAAKPRAHWRWQVTVRKGDQVLALGLAMSICLRGQQPFGENPTPEQLAREQDEVRRRVMLYVAWRHQRKP